MSKSVLDKTMENKQKHRDIKLVTSDIKHLVSEPNWLTAKWFLEIILTAQVRKDKRQVFYDLPSLFRCFLIHIKIDDFCQVISKDTEERFDTLSYK